MQVADYFIFNPLTRVELKLFQMAIALSSEIASADRIPHAKVIELMNCLDKLYLVTSEDRKAVVEHDRNFFAQTYHAYLIQSGYFQMDHAKGLPPLEYKYGEVTYINGITTGEVLGEQIGAEVMTEG